MNYEMYDKFDAIHNALGGFIHGPQLFVRMRSNWNEESRFYCSFEYVEVKRGGVLEGTHGDGSSPEEAMENYLSKIRNQTLVYRAGSENRKEVAIL